MSSSSKKPVKPEPPAAVAKVAAPPPGPGRVRLQDVRKRDDRYYTAIVAAVGEQVLGIKVGDHVVFRAGDKELAQGGEFPAHYLDSVGPAA